MPNVPSCFADRIGDLVPLSTAEREAFARLEERRRSLRRGQALVRENDRNDEVFVLQSGMMMSYVLLDDGRRHILRLLFPGDLLGLSALLYSKSPETIAALGDCVVCPFDRTAITALVTGHPRLAAILIAIGEMERVALTDRLALGRTSAKARVAALLLEIRHRRRDLDGLPAGATFVLGLTQEEVGDATGLTAVHVNRMIRQLEHEGLIARKGGRVTLIDEPSLARVANRVDRGDGLDLGWLPDPR